MDAPHPRVDRLAFAAGEQVAEVGGVEAARQEGLLGDVFATLGEPLVEVLGVPGDPAHPHRRDVQQVERILGAVGDAGAEAPVPVDQVDLEGAAFSVLAEQVDRDEGAGSAPAHDRDPLSF